MSKPLCAKLAALGAGLGFSLLAHAGPYSGLYVFGDSLSDAGNDLQITAGLVPSPTYYTNGAATGRFTNGLNYADRLAAGLGLSLAPSLAGGTDYAYGGARTNYVLAGLVPYGALSFNQQVSAYDASHASADAGALYVLWIGSNDMADAVSAAAGGNPAAIGAAITTAMQGIGGAIQDLSSRGATHFLIPNVPDLSLTPAIRGYLNPGLSSLARSASLSFNAALGTLLGSYGTLDIRTLDAYGLQTAITGDPSAYGFDNVASACYSGDVDGQPVAGSGGPNPPTVCATPGTYMYWDYEHPSDALHAQIGAAALAAAVPEPAAWALMAAGLGIVGWMRARRG